MEVCLGVSGGVCIQYGLLEFADFRSRRCDFEQTRRQNDQHNVERLGVKINETREMAGKDKTAKHDVF